MKGIAILFLISSAIAYPLSANSQYIPSAPVSKPLAILAYNATFAASLNGGKGNLTNIECSNCEISCGMNGAFPLSNDTKTESYYQAVSVGNLIDLELARNASWDYVDENPPSSHLNLVQIHQKIHCLNCFYGLSRINQTVII